MGDAAKSRGYATRTLPILTGEIIATLPLLFNRAVSESGQKSKLVKNPPVLADSSRGCRFFGWCFGQLGAQPGQNQVPGANRKSRRDAFWQPVNSQAESRIRQCAPGGSRCREITGRAYYRSENLQLVRKMRAEPERLWSLNSEKVEDQIIPAIPAGHSARRHVPIQRAAGWSSLDLRVCWTFFCLAEPK